MMKNLNQCLPNLGEKLLEEIKSSSTGKKFAKNELVVEQGEILRFLPIVIEGRVKVFTYEASMQFLLYFINKGETCIFSFAHIFDEEPVSFSGLTEVDSELLLLPIHKVREWSEQYPRFNAMLLKAYQKHYNDLLHTTKEVVCYNLEDRLLNYLKRRKQLEGSDILKLSHLEIAGDLGTSREVISRLMKKLEHSQEIEQLGRKIKVL